MRIRSMIHHHVLCSDETILEQGMIVGVSHTPIIHYHPHHHCRDESLREMLLSWGLPAQLGLLR